MKRLGLTLALSLAGLLSCFLPAEERATLDLEVGRAKAEGLEVEIEDGLAAVQHFDGQTLTLWAQAPRLRITLKHTGASKRPLDLEVLNCMPSAALSIDGGASLAPEPVVGRRAACKFRIELDAQHELVLFSTREDPTQPFVFAVLSDIQGGIDKVQDIFARMNQDPELEFVVSTGDLTDHGSRGELTRFQSELAQLEIPFYATAGNHEMGSPPEHWHTLFGLFNVHFRYADVAFSLLDSGNATIDPEVYTRLDGYLAQHRARPHMVLTHVPPLDPQGLRQGSFRSRKEAAKFLKRLAEGKVDALFLGHIHSYYAFSSAGIPTYISGGGGAIQEQLDGIARHYLRVHVHPERGISEVGLVRVD